MTDEKPFSDIFKAAIKALEEGHDPLDVSFLVEHDVTLDQAFELSEQLASGGRLLLYFQNQLKSDDQNKRLEALLMLVVASKFSG
jgi:hypothetical protein